MGTTSKPIVLQPVDNSKDYIPQFLDAIQINTESRGRQKDAAGNPLVGRHADGTLPPTSKRAYGAGQIQIGTAQDAAAKHGIPFSVDKLMTDKNYNLRLADAHMGDLMNKYGGDRTLARAAYHSGSGTVDKAIATYGRAGFAQGLGPEGRKYIQMGGSSGGGGVGGGAVASVPGPEAFLAGLASKLGPEAKASGGVTSNAGAIFGSDSKINEQTAAVQADLTKQGQAIDVLDQVSQAAQATQMGAKIQQVEQTSQISDQIIEGTAKLTAQVKPVFQARERIADQLDKLATMNPIERGLRGIFDLNYDQDHLTKQLSDFDRTLQVRANDFDYLNKLHSTAMTEIDRRYALDTGVSQLTVDQAKEDMGLAGLHLAQTTGILQNTNETIRNQASVISAKNLAREDLLGRLDMPTVNDLANQAQANNGMINFNGVELSYHELRERAEKDEQQQLGLEAVRMSIAGNRMDIADKYATNVAKSLTRPQLEAAMAAGGVYQGIQLPQDVLTSSYAGMVQRQQLQGEEVLRQLPGAQAMNIAGTTIQNDAAMYNRSQSFMGEADARAVTPIFNAQKELVGQLHQAIATNQPQAIITALTQKIVANSQGVNATVDAAVLRSAGGDKRMAGYLNSFIRGAPMNPGTSIEALTYIALKGGALPEGWQASEESKAIFQKAQQLVKDNMVDPATHKQRSAEQLQLIVSRGLTDQAAEVVGQTRFDRLWGDIPRIAKSAQNPLGNMKPEQWRQAVNASRSDAANALKSELNTTPDNILQMYSTHKPIDSSPQAQALFTKFNQTAGKFNALESQALIGHIDELPRFDPNTDNSDALVNLLESGAAHGIASAYTQSVGNNSPGDYLVNPLASGALESSMAQTANQMRQTKNVMTADRRASARRYDSAYATNPGVRADVILQSIPGVGKEGSQILLPWIKQNVLGNPNPTTTRAMDLAGASNPSPVFGRSVVQQQEGSILAALQSTKFEDPRMEIYRKKAIAGWSDSATQSQTWIQTLTSALGVGE